MPYRDGAAPEPFFVQGGTVIRLSSVVHATHSLNKTGHTEVVVRDCGVHSQLTWSEPWSETDWDAFVKALQERG